MGVIVETGAPREVMVRPQNERRRLSWPASTASWVRSGLPDDHSQHRSLAPGAAELADRASRIAHGGKAVYGARLGILMLEARFPRIPGDMGNAGTWPFPVLYKVVRGASPRRVVTESAAGLLDDFLAAARELVDLGADGITTNCGFLSIYQKEHRGARRRAGRDLEPDAGAVHRERPAAGAEVGVLTVSAATLTATI